MSRGELKSVISAVGLDNLIDERADGAEMLRYLAYAEAKEEMLLDNQNLLKTPIVRNGRKATVGYRPEVWSEWD